MVLEVNGRKVRDLEKLSPLLNTRYGKISLTLVPMETKNMSRDRSGQPASSRGEASRVRKARDLFAKVSTLVPCSLDNIFTHTKVRVKSKPI